MAKKLKIACISINSLNLNKNRYIITGDQSKIYNFPLLSLEGTILDHLGFKCVSLNSLMVIQKHPFEFWNSLNEPVAICLNSMGGFLEV